MEQVAEYWRSGRGLAHITPPSNRYPEGESFMGFLTGLSVGRSVHEFGCGIGRLAGAFSPGQYVGTDICGAAIEQAKKDHLEHEFCTAGRESPKADLTLCHTVLLHIPDEQIQPTINSFGSPLVVVSEVMGRGWRREGEPPVFNREPEEYVGPFSRCGYKHRRTVYIPYPHYADTNLTVMVFERALLSA